MSDVIGIMGDSLDAQIEDMNKELEAKYQEIRDAHRPGVCYEGNSNIPWYDCSNSACSAYDADTISEFEKHQEQMVEAYKAEKAIQAREEAEAEFSAYLEALKNSADNEPQLRNEILKQLTVHKFQNM
jgi:hypothetical protein